MTEDHRLLVPSPEVDPGDLGEEDQEIPSGDGATVVTVPLPSTQSKERLDRIVARELGLTRSFATKLIRRGQVALDPPERVKPSFQCGGGTMLRVTLPPPQRLELEPEPVPFGVVFSDSDCIVVHKPAGVVVHPSPGHWRGTLVHGLLHAFPDIGAVNGIVRPGIVHRLDSGTSGLMVVARNMWAHDALSRSFRDRRVRKRYLALIHRPPAWTRQEIRLPIGRDPGHRLRMAVNADGREALTEVWVLQNFPRHALVACDLHTGRTHQIRVHLAFLGHPLVGDRLYGPSYPPPEGFDRVFLHAWQLAFPHPRTGELLSFQAPLPKDLLSVLQALR